MANIKYEIFRDRKGFSVINWIKSNEKKSYEDFKSFLSSKSVIAPEEEYFKKAFLSVEKNNHDESQDKDSNRTETVPINVEVSLPDLDKVLDENPKDDKPKNRRQRRRKKLEDES